MSIMTLTHVCYVTNPRPAGVFGRTSPAGGGEILPPPHPSCLTRKREAVGRRARRQSKAIAEYVLSNLKIVLKGHMSDQGQVKGQNRDFSPYRLR